MKNESRKTIRLMMMLLSSVIVVGCTTQRMTSACPAIGLSIDSRLKRADMATIDAYNTEVAK